MPRAGARRRGARAGADAAGSAGADGLRHRRDAPGDRDDPRRRRERRRRPRRSHRWRMAKSLLAQGISHLWLTGCGDSAFAGQAAALAFQRHTAVTPHPVTPWTSLGTRPATCRAGSAVVGVSFSGRVGRTTEAPLQARRFGHPTYALTNAAGRSAGPGQRRGGPPRRHDPGLLPRHLDVRRDARQPAAPGRRRSASSTGGDGDAGPALVAAARAGGPHPGRCRPSRPASRRTPARPAVGRPSSAPGRTRRRRRFGAAKLFEGPQQLAVSTNLEEWAHEEYFVTTPGDPVVLVNPSAPRHDRGLEILSELRYVGADADRRLRPGPAGLAARRTSSSCR